MKVLVIFFILFAINSMLKRYRINTEKKIMDDLMNVRDKCVLNNRPIKKEEISKCKYCFAYCNELHYKELFKDNYNEKLKEAPYGMCPYDKCREEK